MKQGGIRASGLAAVIGALLLGLPSDDAHGTAPAAAPVRARAPAAARADIDPATADGAALLARFAAAFAPDAGSGDGTADPADPRCGTSLVRTYLARRASLAPFVVREIDRYLAVTEVVDTLRSDGGHFRLGWVRDGDNAVPLDDVDPADGVPDFIARLAGYLENAWTVEFDQLGLRAPPAPGPIEVTFRRMHYYGYTVPVDPDAGTTRLVLNNTFTRFPPNDDPDGDAIGAARVTAAHELRHASQYVGSRWSEGDWTEMDATWAEELVCPEVNDYVHYLFGDSPVRRPEIALDGEAGGTGSYDDVVFELWLTRRWGDDVVRDYWERRALLREESPLRAWDEVLTTRGVSLTGAWGEFISWNYATGDRVLAGVGYPDAAEFPTCEPAVTFVDFPAQVTGTVAHLAAAPIRVTGLSTLGDRLLAVDLLGEDVPSPLALAVYARLDDDSGWLDTVGLDRRGQARFVLPVPAGRLREVGLVVGNGSLDGPARVFTVKVDTLTGPVIAPAGTLTAIEPNPCNAATWLSCEITARAATTVDIVDLSGRRLRRLWSGSLSPGSHRFAWDGRGDDGQPAPAGVYLAALNVGGAMHCRKLTLVR